MLAARERGMIMRSRANTSSLLFLISDISAYNIRKFKVAWEDAFRKCAGGFWQYLGAAYADFAIRNFMTEGIFRPIQAKVRGRRQVNARRRA
jgi:hypothetical protein